MALKELNGNYNGLKGDLVHRIRNVTGLTFGENPTANIRKDIFSSEEFLSENPDKPLEVGMENFPLSQDAADKIKKILYQEIRNKKANVKTVNHESEKDDEGEVIAEAYTEETFDSPYIDMVDC